MKKVISGILFLFLVVITFQLGNVSHAEGNNIFYWSFDGHMNDLSHHNLDCDGGGFYDEGVVGSAIDLSDGGFLMTDSVPIDFKKFTISLWVKIYESSNGYAIMLAKGSKTAGHFELYFAKSGGDGSLSDFEIRLWSPDFLDYQTGKIVEYEKWMHIAATYDGSIGKIYLDGEKIYESSASSGLKDVTDIDNNKIAIGALVEGALPVFGLIDEVVLADYVFSEDDIVKLAKSPATAAEEIKSKVLANYPEGVTPRPDPTPTPEPTSTPEPTATPTPTTAPTATVSKTASPGGTSDKGISNPVKIVIIVVVTLVIAACVLFFIFKKK